jgi:hypothetical protein
MFSLQASPVDKGQVLQLQNHTLMKQGVTHVDICYTLTIFDTNAIIKMSSRV